MQKVLKKFKIVPVVYGDASPQELSAALEPLLRQPDTLLVVSADLSHYEDYETSQSIWIQKQQKW